jgi:hypothetical protein
VFILGIVYMKFDYGPMKLHEMNALLNGDLGGLPDTEKDEGNPRGRVIDLVLPVLVLIVCCTVGMLYVGGYFGTDWWGGTDCAGDFIGAFGNTDAFVGLPWGQHHCPGAHHHLLPLPPGGHLQGRHGVRAQGLHRHGPGHDHPDSGRLPEEHDQRPGRRRLCPRHDAGRQ